MVIKTNRYIAPTKKPHSDKLTFIIPAAGIGKRMKAYGAKSLIQIKGTPLLELQVNNILKTYPNADICVVVGFESDKIRNALKHKINARFVFNPLYETTGATYSISLALENTNTDRAVIICGDVFFDNNALKHILEHNESSMLISNEKAIPTDICAVEASGYVTSLGYNTTYQSWLQVAYLQGREYQVLESIAFKRSVIHNWLLHETLNHVISKGGKFRAIQQPHDSLAKEINNINDLNNIQEELK